MSAYRKPGAPAIAPRPLRSGAALLALPAAAVIVACGSSAHGSSAAGSCAASTPAGYLARARVVAVGIMLTGPAADLGGRRVLVSPARMRVFRYLKGHGPDVISVTTGVTSGNQVAEDGIQPQAGQRWTIYTRSRQLPYQTSICDGTSPARQGT